MLNLPQIASVWSRECAVSEGVDMFPFLQDMFPQTGTKPDINQKVSCHVETVCLLGKRKPDAKVKIGIDMDDYYRIRENAESK